MLEMIKVNILKLETVHLSIPKISGFYQFAQSLVNVMPQIFAVGR